MSATQKNTPDKMEKRKKLRRRLIRIGLVVLILLVLFRLSLIVIFPAVVNRVAKFYKLQYTYDRMELSLLGGNAGIWGLDVKPMEGGDSIAKADYVRGRISTFALLTGKLEIWRLEADGVELWADRDASGRFQKLERFATSSTTSAGSTAAPVKEKAPVDFSSPLNVEALRVTHLRAHYTDQSVTPAISTVVGLDVRVSNLGSQERPTRFEIEVAADPLLTVFRIQGEARAKGRDVDAQMRVQMRGLDLGPAMGYLRPLGIEAKAKEYSAQMFAELKTTAAPSPSYGLRGLLHIHDIAMVADERETFGIEKVDVDFDTLDGTKALINKVDVAGIRTSAERTATGALAFGGIEYDATKAAPIVPTAAPAATRPTSAPVTSISPQFAWQVDELTVNSAAATFRDRAVQPMGEFALILDELKLKGLANEAAKKDATAQLNVVLHSPGISNRIEVGGSMRLLSPTKLVNLQVKINGIKLDALKPYEPAMGVESLLKDGQFQATLQATATPKPDGSVTADTQIKDVRLTDGEQVLLAVDHLYIGGFGRDPKTDLYRVDTIDVAGPELTLERTAAGTLSALGIRTLAEKAAATRPAAATSTTKVATTANAPTTQVAKAATKLPRFELGHFTWKGVKINLRDNAVTPAAQVQIEDAGVDITNVRFDLESLDGGGQTGTIKAWLKAPGLADAIHFDGKVTPGKHSVEASMSAHGEGLKGDFVAPYLRTLGLEPALKEGRFEGTARAGLAQEGDRVTASLAVENVIYSDRDRELAALDALRINDFSFENNELVIGAIEINRPRGMAVREKDGALVAAGIRVLPQMPVSPELAARMKAAQAEAAEKAKTAVLPVVVLKKLAISQAAFDWEDQAARMPVKAKGILDMNLDGLTLGRPSDPATLTMKVSVPGSLDEFTMHGTLMTQPEHQGAHLEMQAKGLNAGPFLGYLPENIEPKIVDGQIHAVVDSEVTPNAEGGQKAKFGITQISIADAGTKLMAIDEVSIAASRIDPAKRVIAIDSIKFTGLDTQFSRSPDGRMDFGRILVGAKAASAPVKANAPLAAVVAAEPVKAPRAVLPDPKTLPLITVDQLTFNIKRLAFADMKRADASPIELRDFTLSNDGKLEALGPVAGMRPPLKFKINGQLWPVVDQFVVTTSATPFASQPEVRAQVNMTGIRGDGVLAIAPEAASKIDGSALTNGTFAAKFETRLRLDRRNPLDFDVSRGFDFEALVRDVAFRASPDQPPTIGIDEIRVDRGRIEPQDGSLVISQLELQKPIALVTKEKNGFTIGGFVIKGTAPTTQPDAAATQVAATEPAAETQKVAKAPEPTKPAKADKAKPVAMAAPAAAKPAGEVMIQKLLASGLDVKYIDNTVDPPFVAPLNGLELEMRDVTTLALTQAKPIRFTYLVYSGQVKVPAPRRQGVLAAALSDTSDDYVDRDFFAQVAGSGNITLYPRPAGWARTSINGLELSAMKSLAASYGVKLYKGTFDGTVDLRLKGDGSGNVKSTLTLTDLVMSEPPKGPLARLFHLDMGLDAALFVLRDPDGSITLPVSFGLRDDQIKMGELYTSGIGAVTQALAVGIASSPIKLAQAIGSLGGGEEEHGSTRNVTAKIPFEAGSVVLGNRGMGDLDRIVQRMRFDRTLTVTVAHTLGAGDVELAASRANPDRPTTLALVAQLRAKRADLARTRAEAAGKVRAQMGSGADADTLKASMQRVQALDQEIAQTDSAIDNMADMLRAGADRQKDRRTRAAALEIGNERLAAVRQLLLDSGVIDIDKRMTVVSAQFNPSQETNGNVTVSLVGKREGFIERMLGKISPF